VHPLRVLRPRLPAVRDQAGLKRKGCSHPPREMEVFPLSLPDEKLWQNALLTLRGLFLSTLLIGPMRFMDSKALKKKPIAVFIMLQRMFYLFIATIPFFVPDRRAHLLVLAVTAMNIPASIANIGWQAFSSKVVPPERRAAAFAARNRLINLTGTVVVLVVAPQGLGIGEG
jgi:hypothetical protein